MIWEWIVVCWILCLIFCWVSMSAIVGLDFCWFVFWTEIVGLDFCWFVFWIECCWIVGVYAGDGVDDGVCCIEVVHRYDCNRTAMDGSSLAFYGKQPIFCDIQACHPRNH